MSIPLTINGVVFDYPETDDVDWGPEATDWAAAVTSGMLQKSAGLFQLLAELDLGTGFGVKSIYYKTRSSDIATTGQFRLAHSDIINFRNNANDGNLALGVSASDTLTFNGSDIQGSISVSDSATIDLSFVANVLTADVIALSITNAQISNSAAIDYSKLNLTGGIINSDVSASAAIAQSKLDLSITNSQLSGSAGITNANLAAMANNTIKGNVSGGSAVPSDLTATQVTALLNVMVGDSGSGGTKGLVPAPSAGDTAAGKFLKADGSWTVPAGGGDVAGPGSSTDNGFVRFDGLTGKVIKNSPATITNADVIAAAGIVYSKLNLTGGILNADISASAAIAYSKLAGMTAGSILMGNGSGLPTVTAITGDVLLSSSGVTSYNGIVPLSKGGTNKNMTAINGGLVWTDTDSLEVTAAGTSGDWVLSGGAGTPTMSSTTVTPKFIAGTTNVAQLTVTGASGQTTNIFRVEANGGGALLQTIPAKGTSIVGVTDGTAAAAGVVGEYMGGTTATSSTVPAAGAYGDLGSVTLTPGDWDIHGLCMFTNNGATVSGSFLLGISTTSGNSATGLVFGFNAIAVTPSTVSAANTGTIPAFRVSITVNTTYYLKVRCNAYSVATPTVDGYIGARRMR